MNNLTYEQIELVREGVCEACKGDFYMQDTMCYKRCEAFQEEARKMTKEGELE